MSESGQTRTVELPESLLERLEVHLQHGQWDSVEEYVRYVLEDVVHHLEEEDVGTGETVDRGAVEDKLQSLGYLE